MLTLHLHAELLFILKLLLSADFISKLTFSKKSFMNTIRVSNCLDPDHDRLSVGPNLGPNCLQRLEFYRR